MYFQFLVSIAWVHCASGNIWIFWHEFMFKHNFCVYNLTITSTCYGQHVECVRREVQMVLFNTMSTVCAVNRTSASIITTIAGVWNSCRWLIINFPFPSRSSPPKNSGRTCLYVLQGIWLLPLDFQGLFIIIMIALLLIYAYYNYYLTSNSGRDKSELSWSTSQLWFVNIAIIVTIIVIFTLMVIITIMMMQMKATWGLWQWRQYWRVPMSVFRYQSFYKFDTVTMKTMTLWLWPWSPSSGLFFCLLRSFLLLFRSFFVASQKFFCCFSED